MDLEVDLEVVAEVEVVLIRLTYNLSRCMPDVLLRMSQLRHLSEHSYPSEPDGWYANLHLLDLNNKYVSHIYQI